MAESALDQVRLNAQDCIGTLALAKIVRGGRGVTKWIFVF
jgi:hypothetical protein